MSVLVGSKSGHGLRTGMVWLHALQRMAQHSSALHVDFALLCDEGALDTASRPKVVVHGAPRRLGVRAVVGGTIFAAHVARSRPGEGDVDQTVFVDGGLDGVGIAICSELNGDAVGEEGMLLLVEAVVGDGIAVP